MQPVKTPDIGIRRPTHSARLSKASPQYSRGTRRESTTIPRRTRGAGTSCICAGSALKRTQRGFWITEPGNTGFKISLNCRLCKRDHPSTVKPHLKRQNRLWASWRTPRRPNTATISTRTTNYANRCSAAGRIGRHTSLRYTGSDRTQKNLIVIR